MTAGTFTVVPVVREVGRDAVVASRFAVVRLPDDLAREELEEALYRQQVLAGQRWRELVALRAERDALAVAAREREATIARLEVALSRATRPGLPLWRAWAGLALLALRVLGALVVDALVVVGAGVLLAVALLGLAALVLVGFM